MTNDGASYYYQEDLVSITVLERLQIELNNRNYLYKEDGYGSQFDEYQAYKELLNENGLDYSDIYNKDTMYKKLKNTVYAVLTAVANDTDLFRQLTTEFGTSGQAYEWLERRLNRLEREIAAIPDSADEDDKKGAFTFFSVN